MGQDLAHSLIFELVLRLHYIGGHVATCGVDPEFATVHDNHAFFRLLFQNDCFHLTCSGI